MKTYLVGGAVRDRLLGLPVVDRDYVVVGATPTQMLAAGFQQVGKDFPVFLHPQTQSEYALARTERKQGRGYTGFAVNADASVTLEQDLERRDLTINAIAETESGELIDPYQGQRDLEQRILRHVSPAFTEDPLRVLRVARFAARFRHLGFQIAPETQQLLATIAASGELETISAERVWRETNLALASHSPEVYFSVLKQATALGPWFAEFEVNELDSGLDRLIRCTQLTDDPHVRGAALLSSLSLEAAATLCDRLRAPNSVQQLARAAIQTDNFWQSDWSATAITSVFGKIDGWRQADRVSALLLIWQAQGLAVAASEALRACYAAAQAINAQHVLANQTADQSQQDLKGPELGAAIQAARLHAITETLAKYEPQ